MAVASIEMDKVVFLGALGVGKTSLIERIRSGKSIEVSSNGQPSDYAPTTESKWTHNIALPDGKTITAVEIIDTTGAKTPLGEEIRNMHTVFGNAFVVVYSVKDRSSFEMAREQLKNVTHIKKALQRHDHVPILLVATNCGEKDGVREVSPAEGKQLAGSFWDCSYRETSNLWMDDIRLIDGWLLNEVLLRPTGDKPKKGLKIVATLKSWMQRLSGATAPIMLIRTPLAITAGSSQVDGRKQVNRSHSRQQMFFRLMSARTRRQFSVTTE